MGRKSTLAAPPAPQPVPWRRAIALVASSVNPDFRSRTRVLRVKSRAGSEGTNGAVPTCQRGQRQQQDSSEQVERDTQSTAASSRADTTRQVAALSCGHSEDVSNPFRQTLPGHRLIRLKYDSRRRPSKDLRHWSWRRSRHYSLQGRLVCLGDVAARDNCGRCI